MDRRGKPGEAWALAIAAAAVAALPVLAAPATAGASAAVQEAAVPVKEAPDVALEGSFGPLDFDPSVPLSPQAALPGWGARVGITLGWGLTSLLAARAGADWFPAIPVFGLMTLIVFERVLYDASSAAPRGLWLAAGDPLSIAFHAAVSSMVLLMSLSSMKFSIDVSPAGGVMSGMMSQSSEGGMQGVSGDTVMFRSLSAPVDRIVDLLWKHYMPGRDRIWHVRLGPVVSNGKVTGVIGGLSLVL